MRLTVCFAAGAAFSLLLLGLFINVLVDRHFNQLDDELLLGKLSLLREALGGVRTPGDLDALPGRLTAALVGHPGVSVMIAVPQGRILFETRGAEFPARLRRDASSGKAHVPVEWTDPTNRPMRGICAPAPTGLGDTPTVSVCVSTDLTRHREYLTAFLVSLWMIVCCAALAIGILGAVIARRELRPIRSFEQGAATITSAQLNHRLEVQGLPVELRGMAIAFNKMLERLQISFEKLSDYASDLAHEIRTPVNALMMQTQVTLTKRRDTESYRQVLEENLEELTRLSRTLEDMLLLAKAESRLFTPNRELVDLGLETRRIVDYYRGLADDKGIDLDCAGDGHVHGDKLMLGRAINNLVSNAVKYTQRGGRIRVRIHAPEQSTVRLSVANTAMISARDQQSLFQRFRRGRDGLDQGESGVGLGLAIVRSIMRAHGGDAVVHCEDGIATFELLIPA